MRVPARLLPVIYIVIALILLLGAGIVLARGQSKTDPKTLFWNAIEQNLTETGMTCTIQETAGASSTRQAISLDLASKTKLRSIITANTSATTNLEVEEINLPQGIFVRYISVRTTEKNASGQTPDFSKALNVWSKSTPNPQQPSLFGRTTLGNCIVPLAYLSRQQTQKLMTELHKNTIFQTDFEKSTVTELSRRSARVYTVMVQPGPYISFLKQVAVAYGLNDLDNVDGASYNQKPTEKLKFYIDSGTQRLVRIDYTNKQRSITFTGFGEVPDITVPRSSITAEELQKRLPGQ